MEQTISASATVKRMLARRSRSVWTILFAALLALVVVTINEVSYRESRDALENLGRRGEARTNIQTLWRSLVDAETGQRGYLLTANRQYLKPYQDTFVNIDQSIKWITNYYGDDEQALPVIADIKVQIEAKQSELAKSIDYFDVGNHDAWKDLIQTGVGNRSMQTIRTLSEKLLAIESERVVRERQDVFDTLRRTRIGFNVMTGFGILAILLFLRQVNLTDRQQQRHSDEVQNERDLLETEVTSRTAELTDLAKHLQSAREDERGKLSRELHDELGALLTAAKLDIARLKRAIGAMTPDVESRIAHLNETVNQGIALKREIIESLRPSSLSNLGLVAAIEIQIREFTERSGIRVFDELAPVAVTEAIQITIYRLIQESLTNIAKYAGATEVRISLRSEGGRAWISVTDNGRGFNVTERRASTHGLSGMRFRVETEGGEMQIDSRPNNGTRIVAWVPLSAREAATETAYDTAL
jgi:signal transduction histidine kinase